jgi:tRNA-dihydrouridine synthase B
MNQNRMHFPFAGDIPLLLAPMAGYTDTYFRRMCKLFGADVVFTEMISADGIVRENDRGWDLAFFSEEERPIGVQLFGSSPETMAKAACRLERLKPDFIDLNFGCPVKKVVKRNCGASLMRDLELMKHITSEVVQNLKIPVSGKIRAGWDREHINAPQAAIALQEAGVSFVTVHGRTRNQNYSAPSSRTVIRDVVRSVDIPVIGNGDIFSPDDALCVLEETGCDGIMIARGSFGHPWIFRQTKSFLSDRTYLPSPEIPKRFSLLIWYFRNVVKRMGEKKGICWMRKHFISFSKGLPDGAKLRRSAMKIVTFDGILKLIEEYLHTIGCDYKRELLAITDLKLLNTM